MLVFAPFTPKGVICGAASICLRKLSTLARLFRRPVATCLPELHDDLPQIRIVRMALLDKSQAVHHFQHVAVAAEYEAG